MSLEKSNKVGVQRATWKTKVVIMQSFNETTEGAVIRNTNACQE